MLKQFLFRGILLLNVLLLQPDSPVSAANNTDVKPDGDFRAKVVDVHDGDTVSIQLECTQLKFKLRLTGIDAPELKQEFGDEAKEKLKSQVLDKTVTIQTDKKMFDLYGRMLGYIFLDKNKKQFVNRDMIISGLAVSEPVAPNIKFLMQFNAAEQQAIHEKRGFWKNGGLQIRPRYFRNPKSAPEEIPTDSLGVIGIETREGESNREIRNLL